MAMNAEALRKAIPDSILPYPSGPWNRTKYIFWKIITPFHNYWRDLLIELNILKHDFRQDYFLGVLSPGRDLEDFLKHLVAHGYANHFIAWKDADEIVSVRKIESFERQFHLRVFKDREVRGHYEYTPESHPVWHGYEHGMEDRREDFLNLIEEWLAPRELAPVRIPVSVPVPAMAEEA
jgi:hypothetical protein